MKPDVLVELKTLRLHGMAGAWADKYTSDAFLSAIKRKMRSIVPLLMSGLSTHQASTHSTPMRGTLSSEHPAAGVPRSQVLSP